MSNDKSLLNFKKSVNQHIINLSEDDLIKECRRQLINYRDSNIPITNTAILSKIHDLYCGDDEELTLFRGLLFNNKKQTECFNESINDGFIQQHLPTALTSNKSIASEFATTQKTYDDMDLARAFAENRKLGEVITGYEGALLTVNVNSKYCIDLSKAGLSAESEFLMLPNITAKITNDERKLPFSRLFENGQLTIDSVVNDRSNGSENALNYVLINFSDQLTKNQVGHLCDRYTEKNNQQMRSDDAKFLADHGDVLSNAKSTGEIQYIKKTEHKPYDKKESDYGVFVHPNGSVLREWNTTEYVNHKSVNKVLLCTDAHPSYTVVDLAKRGVLYKSQLDQLEDNCNLICAAITDVAKHDKYRATELEHNTFELLRDFASPIALSVMSDAMTPDRSACLTVLNKTESVTSKDDLRAHAEMTKKALLQFAKSVESGRPSGNRPKPRR